MATAEALMTAEEFALRADPGYPEELIRGRVLAMPPPNRRHGVICSKVDRALGNFVEENRLGRVLSNDSGVITERGPDTVRGADIAYYSFTRLPKEADLDGYGPEVPEITVEVRSPSESWSHLQEKIREYLNAGVLIVVVLDPLKQSAYVYSADEAPLTLTVDDDLSFPGILEGFRIRVGRFFEE
jgi:Uma2 family endonuclease